MRRITTDKNGNEVYTYEATALVEKVEDDQVFVADTISVSGDFHYDDVVTKPQPVRLVSSGDLYFVPAEDQ